MRQLILLAGPMRSGKTTFCKALFPLIARESHSAFAIVEENQRDAEGIPVSLSLRNLGTGETFYLGSRGQEPREFGKPYPPFTFSAEAFSWAESNLMKAVGECDCPVLIDEIGPLEVRGGGGFFRMVEWAIENGTCPLLVTIRPDLVEAFIDRLSSSSGMPEHKRFSISSLSFDRTLRSVFNEVFRHCQEGKGILYYEEG